MQIRVTQKHINEGEKIHCTECPIALAISDCLKKSYCAGVSMRRYYIHTLPLSQSCINNELPSKAQDFIIKFDCGRSVEPFDFDIDIPEEYLCKT